MIHRLLLAISLASWCAPLFAEAPDLERLESQFARDVLPFLQSYCLDCHNEELAEAKLNLASFRTPTEIRAAHPTWKIVLARIAAAEMPPKDSEQPSQQKRDAVVEWIRELRSHDAMLNQGDPGLVLPHRLSNAEYNYTIRDLTGIDIRPTASFPLDPANEAGFDNSGESLSMSPALVNKYLGAAREVASHLVLHPRGITFAPHPVETDTDRDKYCVKRIVEFYKRQPTDVADYLYVAWEVARQSNPTPSVDQALVTAAGRHRISPKYLREVWTALHRNSSHGPLALVQQQWRDLPDTIDGANNARKECQAIAAQITKWRGRLSPTFPDLYFEGNHKGSQPFVLWKNRQYASHRRSFARDRLLKKRDDDHPWLNVLVLPSDPNEQAVYLVDLQVFCKVFPDAFYIAERGRDYLGKPKNEQEKGRLLSAGFHSMMGYFRDDTPLCELILDEEQLRELNELWQELNFVASAPQRQYVGFLWFERTDSRYTRDPEFDFARAENKAALTTPLIEKLSQVYLAKAKRSDAGETEQAAIAEFFQQIDKEIRWVEQARLDAEPKHLEAIVEFADRAMRRNLTKDERQSLASFYAAGRTAGLSHEAAIQDLLVYILMSPEFCYRVDLLSSESNDDSPQRVPNKPHQGTPLSSVELASRLSYFLWSSLPDAQLRATAATGQLTKPDVLLRETRRMLRDPKSQGLATEFGGNWLGFRQFQQHNSVDRERFPSFDDALRDAMFEEPIKVLSHVIQTNRSILELIDGSYTFVNQPLAKHYNLKLTSPNETTWQRVDTEGMGRGGLLPMSVFLTLNSPGLRTSPVKRGYWVVRNLLGERIPPPPPNVPDLPEDESTLELSLRETLERHRANQSCAGCHDRFDAVGLAFEGFGPIGEQRKKDLGGRPVDNQAAFPDGETRRGIDGVRRYILESRRDEFVDNLCRKLLSFGLSRTLMLSDEPLVEKMKLELQGDEFRIGTMLETIVLSHQFLNK